MRNTDAELVRRIHNKETNAEAFAELVRRYEKRVFGMVYRLLEDPNDASDVTQEAFLRAYAKLGSFDPERPFMPWLATIALNLARNSLKSSWAKRQTLDESAPSIVDDFERIELLDEVQTALQHLTAEQREVIILRHVADLTYEQIASVTGEKVSTVKSRLFEARKRIEALELRKEARL
ncbi:MAG TPA: sigma-70 family RNA polymerase sigma factor [Candidatus Aquicultor sp.]